MFNIIAMVVAALGALFFFVLGWLHRDRPPVRTDLRRRDGVSVPLAANNGLRRR